MLNKDQFKSTPEGFTNPTALPESDEERNAWLVANKEWWENNPMRYDFSEQLQIQEGSKAFYDEIDRRFFTAAEEFLPARKIPFDSLIPFDQLADKAVLEIGVGSGSHAQLLAIHSGTFCGIDLTEYAVSSTLKRFEVNQIKGEIVKMNAEELNFDNNTFDLIWSWGVIHHSANTQMIVQEIARVLRPGGTVTAMVYHRGFYYYLSALFVWLAKGYFLQGKSLHQAIQDKTDGAIARYYTTEEFSKIFENVDLEVEEVMIMGQKSDILPIPGSRIKWWLLKNIPDSVSRFFTNNLGWGLMLVLTARKK